MNVDYTHVMRQNFERSTCYVRRWCNVFLQKFHWSSFNSWFFFVLVIIFTFSLYKRRVVNTFFFVFSIFCQRFICFFIDNILNLFLFFCSLILKVILVSLFVFFSCRCWLILLYDAILTICKVDATRVFCLRHFCVNRYNRNNFRRVFFEIFNLLLTFFNVKKIFSFTMNVDNKIFTRWRKDSISNASISSIDLSRNKLMILLIKWFLRLFKEFFSKQFEFSWVFHDALEATTWRRYVRSALLVFKARITIMRCDCCNNEISMICYFFFL
jgi:hypothetical protein